MNVAIAELHNLANGSEAAGDKLAASVCRDAIIEIEQLQGQLADVIAKVEQLQGVVDNLTSSAHQKET